MLAEGSFKGRIRGLDVFVKAVLNMNVKKIGSFFFFSFLFSSFIFFSFLFFSSLSFIFVFFFFFLFSFLFFFLSNLICLCGKFVLLLE